MGTGKEKYIGGAKLWDTPKKKFTLILGEQVVTTDKLADGAVAGTKVANSAVSWNKLDNNVQQIINSKAEADIDAITIEELSEILV